MKRINPYKLFIGAFLPNWLLRRRELSQGAKLCYARLAQYAGEHGYARPGQKTLADELAVTERQIRNYVAELEKYKLIESAQVTFAGTNRYYFLWHEWMEMDEPTETTDASNAEEDCRIDRKKTSALSGSKLPPYPEVNCRPIRQDTSTKENQLRESEEENQKDTTPLLVSGELAGEKISPEIEKTLSVSGYMQKIEPKIEEKETLEVTKDFLLTAIEGIVSEIPIEAKRSAKLFHYTLMAKLKEMGWSYGQEHTLEDRGDGKKGRVDILVTYPAMVGIELDRISPRDKSISKLLALDAVRVIVLRECASWPDHIEGIDAIIACGKKPKPDDNHPLAEDYQPSESTVQHIFATYPGIQIGPLVQAMRDWALSKRVLRADWNATLRTFARRKHEEIMTNVKTHSSPSSTDAKTHRNIAAAQRVMEKYGHGPRATT